MTLITRYKHHPILTKNDVPYEVATVHNAGVTKFGDEWQRLSPGGGSARFGRSLQNHRRGRQLDSSARRTL